MKSKSARYRPSIIVNILDIFSHLIFFSQVFFEVVHLPAQQLVHLHLLLDYPLKLLHVRVYVIVHKSDPLNSRYQLTLLSQQLCVLLYCCHMRREYFLLLLQNRSYFLLKREKLLLILASHSTLHRAYVFFDFLLLLLSGCLFLNLFSDPIIFFWWGLLYSNCRLFDRIGSILFFFFTEGSLILVLRCLSRNLLWSLPRLRRILTLILLGRCNHLWRHFILRVFRLKYLFHVLIFRGMTLFFFDIIRTLCFMNFFFRF